MENQNCEEIKKKRSLSLAQLSCVYFVLTILIVLVLQNYKQLLTWCIHGFFFFVWIFENYEIFLKPLAVLLKKIWIAIPFMILLGIAISKWQEFNLEKMWLIWLFMAVVFMLPILALIISLLRLHFVPYFG